ncbi:helix-turn-helix transcriptional regulator [Serratia rubidaea]|uniref:helix-turn-helix transcriptional regulator n=1 Tax=Serratia rubidaea TaxID=61652 RepID=UPI0022B92A6E|nr:helix-turn-helix domain-containing protein [Serratia rubidaea]WBF46142.1 helix-turn-helix domain-containing protein [Serratia rubidaea]
MSGQMPSKFFSAKEWNIIFLLLQGFSEKEMAQCLNRTLRTIKFHKTNILQKTHCAHTRDFVLLACRHGWQYSIPPAFLPPGYFIRP